MARIEPHKTKFKILLGLVLILVSTPLLIYTNCGNISDVSQDTVSLDPTQKDLSNPSCLQGTQCKPKIATGGMHTCVLLNGLVECWGDNSMGQLGNGTTVSSSLPVAVPNLTGVTAIEAGRNETCVIANGAVKCWGDNTFGQLGNGTTGGFSSSPVTVSNLTGATAISVGGHHVCAINGSQKVKCWGFNNVGQLGLNNTTNINTPQLIPTLSNVIAISAGVAHSCAIVSGGTAQCWGYNALGQLGIGVQVANKLIPTPVINLTSATAIESGQYHTCALKSNNTIKCWGDNFAGQLGGGTPMVQKSLSPILVVNITNAIALDLGEHHSCANLSSGNTQCWGENIQGQLGNGTITANPTPTPVSANILINSTEIEAGGSHTCVVNNSKVNCWGNNANGQLGNGTNNSPQLIPGIPLTTLVCNTCSWQPTSLVNAPAARNNHTTIWTGSPLNQMIVWSGRGAGGFVVSDGARLNPNSNVWSSMAPSPLSAREEATAIWTGPPLNKMIVWGGTNWPPTTQYNDGAIYDPVGNSWTSMSTATGIPPSARYGHTTVWTGPPLNKMIVWGGMGPMGPLGDGGIYDPNTNSWSSIGAASGTPPLARYGHSVVWTGSEMIVWGGVGPTVVLGDGARYNPSAGPNGTWIPIPAGMIGEPSSRDWHSVVWTGIEMIVWGGVNFSGSQNDGGKYNPVTNIWTPTSLIGAPQPQSSQNAVWTGSQMIVFGSGGAIYDPITDIWTPICTNQVPTSRISFGTVWTGSKMVVWGGSGGANPLNDGGIYTP